MSVLLGNGDGTFQPRSTTRSGVSPVAIVAGDFTGDGRLDLAVADLTTAIRRRVGPAGQRRRHVPTTVRNAERGRERPGRHRGGGLHRRRPDSTWPSPTNGDNDGVGAAGQRRRHVPAPGHLRGRDRARSRIVAGDFNGDGRLDLAVANCGYDDDRVGAAGQRRRHVPARRSPTRSGSDPDAIVAGDFTGDGRPRPGRRQRGVGNDGLGAAGQRRRHVPARRSPTRSGSDPVAIVAGDFTGDGQLDLAVAERVSDDDGVGAAGQRRRHLPAPGHLRGRGRIPAAIVAGDFTGDGHLDLAVANVQLDNTVSVLLGNGDGTFQPAGHLRGRDRTRTPSWRAISPATASSTWPSPT